ncbi:MAG TPA: cytochrome C oxidase subunit IV family protein [Thermoanaerobaculia bacterium]|nr:cytochrome C oxidase subunit IV family protein [Thermoanaerobaculia bacterium]
MAEPSHEQAHEHTPHVHVTPLWIYIAVFLALAFGTLLTWWVSTINIEIVVFGHLISLNTPIALLIATAKAVLVILFFMHVIHSTRLTWVVVIGAFLWLGVLFVLTFADYLTRGWSLY